ncbi:hypothetical protein BDF14DRAFT_1003259 [Spinellus fusiger]|nr:hypothetical protein BDF14DRAFT_1003259 [Spinellus fusiger]
MEKGAQPSIENTLGCLPKEVASNPETLRFMERGTVPDTVETNTYWHSSRLVPEEKAPPRPKVSQSERFKQLREKAEVSSNVTEKRANIIDRQASTHKYFRPGHIEERKKKVLSEEEEQELEKQRLRRQQEVALLTKRSAVKNNPLLKKFEQQTPDTPVLSKSAFTAKTPSSIKDDFFSSKQILCIFKCLSSRRSE